MNDKNASKMTSAKRIEEIKQIIFNELKNFKAKISISNIAKFLNDPNVEIQINMINILKDGYEVYPEEIDKLIDIMTRSYMRNQKYIAISLLTELSKIHPDYAFDKLSKIIYIQSDLIESTSDAIKSVWRDNIDDLIKNIKAYWDLNKNVNLKQTALTCIDTSLLSDSEIILDYLNIFINDANPEIRFQSALKIRDLYIKEPYVVEAKLREWLKDNNKFSSQTIILAFKEINKRRDSMLLDRTCIIMNNWLRNESESIKNAASKILGIIKEQI